MTADEYRRDPRTSPARRERARRMLLSEDECRAEDAAEEADLRQLAECDRAEASAKGAYKAG